MSNFIVSARKYRPATFASVVGQSHITSTLKNAISRGQLAHAYLFCGPRGVGKTTCARIFAKAINCLDPQDAEACNACESCKAFNEGRSFNIHELDAASNNSVDDIRNLTDQVRIPPQVGRYSVYIIDEVHMLSLQAFNAFLKTLEEPPAHAVFILATTEKHKIIPTILSRCQIYDFNRIRVEDSVQYLRYIAEQEGVSFDEESLHIIAQKADGGMRDALSMFDKVVSFSGSQLTGALVAETLNVLDYDTYFQVTQYVLAGNYTDALLLFDEVLRKGFSGQTFIAGLNNHFRDLLMCKNPQTLTLLEVTGSVAERYKTQAAECPVPLLFHGIDLLTSVDASFRTAANQRLHVELGLMKLCGLGQKKNNDDLTPSLPLLVERSVASTEGSVSTSVPTPVTSSPRTEAEPSASIGVSASSTTAPTFQNVAESTSATVATTLAPENQPRSAVTPTAEPTPAEHTRTEPATTPPAKSPSTPKSGSGFSPLSGRSIGSILNPVAVESEEPEEEPAEEPEVAVEVDDQTQRKLEKGCRLYAEELMENRPRIGVLFQEATVEGNRVLVKVPNESSYDEWMRMLSDIQRRLLELSGLRIPIEIQVTIEANTNGLKPVKAEDRLRYLTEKNPLIHTLRQALELDVE